MMMLAAIAALATVASAAASHAHEDGLPSYHYGAPLHVECMNRSS